MAKEPATVVLRRVLQLAQHGHVREGSKSHAIMTRLTKAFSRQDPVLTKLAEEIVYGAQE